MRPEDIFVGTELKFKVDISSTGFNMDSDDWSVKIVRGNKSREFFKADCIAGEDGWYVCFDTRDFGPGLYFAVITAHVPDSDFGDGIRTEVKKFKLIMVEGHLQFLQMQHTFV